MSARFASVVSGFLALVVGSVTIASAPAPKAPPDALDVTKAKFQIVGATFVTKVQGANATRFEESQLDKFRGLILTVQVTKPAGEELTLFAQDFVLHYRFGDKTDVARCQGLSGFSGQMDVDRPMSLFANGIGRTTTGLSTTKLDTMYLDLFFQFMEPNTSDIHLFVAQPTGAWFQTNGWK